MIDYPNLLGGLLSSEFPYLVFILCGYFFARNDILRRDGLHTLSKLMIEIFIPIYLFINVCRSTSAANIQKNYLIILSTIFYILFAGGVALLYSIQTNMDVRYRYTWIFMIAITDIKLVHRLIVNTFCFHISDKSEHETDFCEDVLTNNFVHMFFQGLFTWYIAFNFIRKDRMNANKVEIILERVSKINKNEENKAQSIIENSHNKFEINSEEDQNKLKNFVEKSQIKVKATSELLKEIDPYIKVTRENEEKWCKEMIYIMLRPPLIGMFTGFVVGYIIEIQTWLFNTKTAVFLFFDTFNNIANSHIICGYLIIGANLYLNDQKDNKVRISKRDMLASLTIKSLFLPFIGVIFSVIATNQIPFNRALIFTAFIQWIIPTSIDIIAIIQLKEINVKDACVLLLLQWIIFVCLSNFIHVPPFLAIIT